MKAFIPSLPEVGREAIIVLCGALLAALIVGQSPPLRDWIKKQWGAAKAPEAGDYI